MSIRDPCLAMTHIQSRARHEPADLIHIYPPERSREALDSAAALP
jgi:hypothetical protein